MKNPKQNRITPKGELVAHPSYGTFMGNRGILHDAEGKIGRRVWRHRNWITCRIAFKGRKRPVMAPNRYTELFFLDEATALAAGHRPCAQCRHEAYTDFRAALEGGGGLPAAESADALDAGLHRERVWPGQFRQRTWRAGLGDLPNGTMIDHAGDCLLVSGAWLLEWSFDGYRIAGPKSSFGAGPVTVLTPTTCVTALAAGYRPAIHESAFHILDDLQDGRAPFSKVAGQSY